MAAERLACVSVDLDSLHHYCRIHGLPESELPAGAAELVHAVALPRFLELCAGRSVPLTLFAVGEDLANERCARAVQQAHRAGAEVANHSGRHDYALTRRTREQMHLDVEQGEASIQEVTGARPWGFRAPGYTLTAALYQVLQDRGYRYDSSVFPAAPYWAAKAAVMGGMRLFGRRSSAVLDTPRVLLAPRQPYRPDPSSPYARGGGAVVELPITTAGVTRFPFIGTYAATLPRPAVRALYRSARGQPFFNFELHGIDLLDEADGIPPALARVQRDARVPVALKRARLRDVLGWLGDDYRLVTLAGAAETVGRTSGGV
ncbi:MAG TPA: polysaccharide deacetylase family protein [Myxococcales bacterium]|nr:polysaccharide deacetylase family protein [Myxococcales bacterium]